MDTLITNKDSDLLVNYLSEISADKEQSFFILKWKNNIIVKDCDDDGHLIDLSKSVSSPWVQLTAKLKKADRSGRGGHLGCSLSYNSQEYQPHLDININTQGREQTNALIEKCAQTLRQKNYFNFMRYMKNEKYDFK